MSTFREQTRTINENDTQPTPSVPVALEQASSVENPFATFYNGSVFSPVNSNIRDAVVSYVNQNSNNLPPIGQWNVSNVTNMQSVLSNLPDFNEDISNWDVSNVTSFMRLFENSNKFNQPLNNWNVSNVTKFNGMFMDAHAFNQPLNDWNVSNAKSMNFMFKMAWVYLGQFDT